MKIITVKNLMIKTSADEKVVVIDVRTPAEYRGVNVSNFDNLPMEAILTSLDKIPKDVPVYVMCNSGNRSKMVCEDLAIHGFDNLVNVEGGIQAWIKAGLPVNRGENSVMPIIQQVLAIAGGLVIVGVAGAIVVDPLFIWLSGAVGAGLMYAGLSGNCMMAKILGYMPWNK